MNIFQTFLLPIALVYGLIMMVRNVLFRLNILPSETFSIPIVGIGNLTMGGSGKTPMTEYIIRLLQDNYHIATLSRGYKREGKGFLIVSRRTNIKYSGDEPLQIAKKFDQVKVALDENRRRGIKRLLQKYPSLDIILLDDAFQHRYVRPGLTILLTSCNNLFTEDYVFPSGTLREFICGYKRADIIIVTKTPKIFSPISRRRILDEICPSPHQKIYFSYIRYGEPLPVYETDLTGQFPEKLTSLMVLTGIADDSSLIDHISRICSEVIPIRFPDHHTFTIRDIELITSRFAGLLTKKKAIVTTEKDMLRLRIPELSVLVKSLPIFYIPIYFEFHGTDGISFRNQIISYVTQGKGNT
jgi:tetraacyldisaccharide 4'-kinase